MYIELKSLEIRTDVQQKPTGATEEEGEEEEREERLNPLEASWNHEPLDHTRSRGKGRLEYGCPYSREDGVESNVRTYRSGPLAAEAASGLSAAVYLHVAL